MSKNPGVLSPRRSAEGAKFSVMTKFVSFASFVEFVIKSAPVDHEWHELYESHECPTDVDAQSPFNLKRIRSQMPESHKHLYQ